MPSSRRAALACAALLLSTAAYAQAQRRRVEAETQLKPQRVALADGRSFNLNLPEGFRLAVAAEGLKRVRFMSLAPDGRVFVTDMHDLTDNRKGVVYVLDQFDPARRKFLKVTPYMSKLRNPNSVAFYTDERGRDWFYLALTDSLVRYRYVRGADAPSGEPEVLATFPDYGLDYKYGGWHLTRTLAFGGGKLYVSVGSSCNACLEKEDVRATVIEMNPDGTGRRFYARGLRNAVGLRWVGDQLYATDMAADHLGKDKPADTMYALQAGTNYGWPFCYQSGPRVFADPEFNPRGRKFRCRGVPAALAAFDAHSAPLGLEHFGADWPSELSNSFLVALHGSTNKSIGRGYRVVRVPEAGGAPADFINGFLQAGKVYGRPADIFRYGPGFGFLLTDDRAGVIYYVYKR
ncbi:MAG: PQQ-dependent sugar dehydrogenase [Acidobacteria bacterium]|nr:PQQ-dependent sugar dehydrogenase [Acidobacteriota bacterium]